MQKHLSLALRATFVFTYLLLTSAVPAIALERADDKPPNVVFLLSDDQRPDTIAALGNAQIRTPNLDRLAREGVTFTRAICANPICTPSRAEIISGCTGFTNGVLDFGRPIAPNLATFAGTLRDAGYTTAYVGKWHNRGRPVAAGFDHTIGLYGGGGGKWAKEQKDWKGWRITGYRGWIFQSADGKTKYPEKGVGLTADISGKFADAAIEFLRRDHSRPFFLQVNFTAPHDPLIMPPGFDGKYPPEKMQLPPNFLPQHPFDHGNLKGRDESLLPFPRPKRLVREVLSMYYSVITHMDQQIGRILQELDSRGLAKNTIVVFSSDHGLGVGSHGIRGKQNMYEHTIGVPMVWRGPKIPRGKRSATQVYLRDIFPTVCDLAGKPIPKTVEGKSMRRALEGDTKPIYPYVFGYFRYKQRMIRGQRWKLITYPEAKREQLFDLANDPHELKDLAQDARFAATKLDLRAKLVAWQRQVGDRLVTEAKK